VGLRFFADHCISNQVINVLRAAGHLRLKEHMAAESPDSAVIGSRISRRLATCLDNPPGGDGRSRLTPWHNSQTKLVCLFCPAKISKRLPACYFTRGLYRKTRAARGPHVSFRRTGNPQPSRQ
jgi:hypothetical protein